MNSLSWLIYAADVATPFAVTCAVFGVIFFLAGTCAAIAASAMLADDASDKFAGKFSVTSRRFAICGAIMVVLAIFMPSRNALYMIAASQMGEKVYQQPETKEMLGDLREVIAKQIKKLKDDK